MSPAAKRTIPADLLAAKRAAASQFLSAAPRRDRPAALTLSLHPRDNVVGVGVGNKVTKGKRTQQQAIRIYVEKKVAKHAVPPELLLPTKLGGYPTDVIETGRFRAQAGVPVARRRRRPARPGNSIGFQYTGADAQYVMAGTLGAVVDDDQGRYILSNNHVLANENALPVGSPIFQPGLLDNGDPAKDEIATLTRFIPLVTPGANSVDCAIAKVLSRNKVAATPLPKVGRLKSGTPVEAAEGMKVHKHGRTTGYTQGHIYDVSADVSIDYDMGTLIFQDQILIRGDGGSFSNAGDSGSMIVDRATQRPVALLFAGSSTHTIANVMSEVLTRLGVRVVA
jgi:hypothetical protein